MIFVDGQVYFRCRWRIWSGDTFADKFQDKITENESDVGLTWFFRLEHGSGGPFGDYPYLLEFFISVLGDYSIHELTHQSDAINAMSGILSVVCTSRNSDLLQGMPIVAFDSMLIFRVFPYQDTRSHCIVDKARRRKSFPSWSRAGWKAIISWVSDPDVSPADLESLNCWLDNRTWIVGFSSRGREKAVPIVDKESSTEQPRKEREISYSSAFQLEFSGRVGTLYTSRTVPDALVSINQAYLEQYLLRFYTVAITLKLSIKLPQLLSVTEHERRYGRIHGSYDLPSAVLYDVEGNLCGLLLLETTDLLGEDGEYELNLLSDS
jgi:hypothetical protein